MKTPAWIALALGLGLLACASQAQAAREPVVVELYTAQGCEGCWRANEVLGDLAELPDVLALTFPVDYWDYLGWEDTFARPEFTERQRAYKKALGLRMLRTPQAVVDGSAQASGFDRDQLLALVQAHRGQTSGLVDVEIVARGRRALVGSGRAPRGRADVWLVRYEPGPVNVTVTRGENRGRVVSHTNVVRELVHLGTWGGRPRAFTLPRTEGAGLRTAILVQARRDGRILGADAEAPRKSEARAGGASRTGSYARRSVDRPASR